MKNYYPILFIWILLSLSSYLAPPSLQAQTRLDSTQFYDLTSPSDSSLDKRTLCTYSSYINSAECFNLSSCITSTYQENTDSWTPLRKREEKFEEEGNRRSIIDYEWDRTKDLWKPTHKSVRILFTDGREIYQYRWNDKDDGWENYYVFRLKTDELGRIIHTYFLAFNNQSKSWNGRRESISYNNRGLRIADVQEAVLWKRIVKWQPTNRSFYSYDEFDRLVLTRIDYWNLDIESWEVESTDETRFDQAGRRNFRLFTNLRTLEKRQEEFFFDQAGRDSVYLLSVGNNALFPVKRIEYAYNRNTLLRQKDCFRWEQDMWILDGSTNLSYNDQAQLTRSETVRWNEDSMDLILTDLEVNVYDNLGRNQEQTILNYNVGQKRLEGARTERSYDARNRVILSSHAIYIADSMKFRYQERFETSFDDLDRETLLAYYRWSTKRNRWEGEFKVRYIFNPNGDLAKEASYNWDEDMEGWVLSRSKKFHWGACKEEAWVQRDENQVRMHPNPVTGGYLFVESDLPQPYQYEIISSTGVQLLSGSGESNFIHLDLSSFLDGLYIIQFSHKDTKIQKKIILHNP
ncbi:MAG: T9SS type A sorting domain-containing protein [Bacteroidota bacterium]